MSKLYYEAPTNQIFKEVKEEAINIWNTYDDIHGYATGKIDRIKDMENIKDNVMSIVAIFDTPNQIKLSIALSDEAREAIADRIRSGGAPDSYNNFI